MKYLLLSANQQLMHAFCKLLILCSDAFRRMSVTSSGGCQRFF